MTLIWLSLHTNLKRQNSSDLLRIYHAHFNAESCHDFSIYTFISVKSYKLFLQKLLEIAQNHSQKQPPEVSHKRFFSNILRYSQENICVGVSFSITLQAISPVTLLKHGLNRDSKTDIFCDYREIYNNTYFEHLRTAALESRNNIFQIRTQQRELLMKKCSPVV